MFQVKKTLLNLIKKTSGVEQKWLIRILLKDTKLRLGEKAILLAYHPDADEVYNITTSLKQVFDVFLFVSAGSCRVCYFSCNLVCVICI